VTRLFDGMAGALTKIFGAPVTHVARPSGAVTVLQSVFRESPVEVLDSEGGQSVWGVSPTWRVAQPEAAGIARGDEIQPGNGRTYRVLNRIAGGSPAADRFWMFELEDITP
jgi:hypothetical protein